MAEARRHQDPRRALILAVIVVLLGAAAFVDRAGSAPAAAAPAELPQVPVAAPAGALSSSWFCAGATDSSGGLAPAAAVIANSGPAVVQGTMEVLSPNRPPVPLAVHVAPYSRQSIPETVPGGSAWVGAVVTVAGGGVAVEQVISSPLGQSVTPCASSGSRQWYFATGATRVNQDVELSILNPYPGGTIVDLSFVTNEGVEAPQAFQALVVPAGGMTVVDLGSHLRRRNTIATAVTARNGRVVAWETDVVSPPAPGAVLVGTAAAANPLADPAAPIAGVTNVLGAPSTATTWTWPDGISGGGVDERYVVYNPSTRTARVALSVNLVAGSAEPLDLNVPADSVGVIDSGQEARIPPGVSHSAVLHSLNRVAVVAERTLAAGPPANRRGIGDLPGGRVAAARWLLAAGTAGPAQDEYVVLYNPGSGTVEATLDGLSGAPPSPLPALSALRIGPRQRLSVLVNEHRAGFAGPIEVRATGPVYAEQDLYGAGSTPGISLSFGVPMAP
ncbi:MAG: DUF5719 family protein [Acidimicrobiales bacterium]